jgi:hypothetical protein
MSFEFAGFQMSSPPRPISIMQVSNGWLVHLPDPTGGETGKKAAQVFMRDLIKDIKDDGNIPRPVENDFMPPQVGDELRLTRDHTIHIFKTLDEVLAFLKYKIIDE